MLKRKGWWHILLKKEYCYILIISIIILIIDIKIIPIIFVKNDLKTIVFIDFIATMVCGIYGLNIALNLNLPTYYISYESNEEKSITSQVIFVSILIIIFNTFFWVASYSESIQSINWFNMTKIYEVILVSLRAALIEEVIYRLFIFSFIILLLKGIFNKFQIKSSRKKITMISGFITSIIFSVFNHSNSIIAFILGGILITYIYYKKGLLVSMLVHFLGDLIPFLIVMIMKKNL